MVFSQPRQPKQIIEEIDEAEGQDRSVGSQVRLQIVKRIKDIEHQRDQVNMGGTNRTSPRGALHQSSQDPLFKDYAQNGNTAFKSPFGSSTVRGGKQQFQDSPIIKQMASTAGSNFGSIQYNSPYADSYSFGAVTREHYYQVHGEKRTIPKNGNYYPRFEIVERRVAGPAYGNKRSLKMALQAKKNIQKVRYDNFEKEVLCDKIFKLLDSTQFNKTNQTWNYRGRTNRTQSQTVSPGPHADQGLPQIEHGNTMDGETKTLTHSNTLLKNSVAQISQPSLASNHDTNHQTSKAMLENAATQNQSIVDDNTGVSPFGKTNTSHFMKNHRFSFHNTPLAQKYTLVSAFPHKHIIKDEVNPDFAQRTNTMDFHKQLKRANFVSPRDPPNENRFNPPDTFTSFNTINQNTSKGQPFSVDIGRVSGRDENIMMKGAAPGLDLSMMVNPIYNPNKEHVMPQTSRQVLDFKKANNRTQYRSIYRKDSSPDYYDVKKISKGFHRQSQIVQEKAMLEIGKQHHRDMSLYYRHNNEAFRNIERDNNRQDFIKKLLSEEY